jgi:outer membrane biosynthesis protein TonB
MSNVHSHRLPALPNRTYRTLLHVAVLITVLGVVAVARIRSSDDATADSPASGGGAPAPTQPANAVAPLTPSPAPTVTPPALAPTQTPTATPTATATASATAEPTPEAAPEPTPDPTPAATPEPASTPAPTRAPAPTAAPTPRPATPAPTTPRPAATGATARAISSAALRNAPSTDALIVGFAPVGAVAPVVGCAAGCAWLQLSTSAGIVWSAAYFWTVTGTLPR